MFGTIVQPEDVVDKSSCDECICLETPTGKLQVGPINGWGSLLSTD